MRRAFGEQAEAEPEPRQGEREPRRRLIAPQVEPEGAGHPGDGDIERLDFGQPAFREHPGVDEKHDAKDEGGLGLIGGRSASSGNESAQQHGASERHTEYTECRREPHAEFGNPAHGRNAGRDGPIDQRRFAHVRLAFHFR